jgi:hypothetical protein
MAHNDKLDDDFDVLLGVLWSNFFIMLEVGNFNHVRLSKGYYLSYFNFSAGCFAFYDNLLDFPMINVDA